MSAAHYTNRQGIAKHFGLSIRTITNLIKRHRIPSLKIGGRRLFVIEQVESYFAQQNSAPLRRVA
jgi:excisionase family DNA binding protein